MGHLLVPPFKLIVFPQELLFVGLGDGVELIETVKLSVVLFEVVFKVSALAFEDANFFPQMIQVSAGRTFLFPTGDKDLVLTLTVGMDLNVLVHAHRVAAFNEI